MLRFIFSGNFIGNFSIGTFTILLSLVYAIGIGQPQYLCLDIPQSLSLKLIFLFPISFSSKISIAFIIASSGAFKLFRIGELIIVPGPV